MRFRWVVGVLAVLLIVSGSHASENVAVNISNNSFLMEDLNSVGLDLPAGEFEASVQFSGDFGGYHSKTVVCMSSRDVFVLTEDEPYYFNNEDFSHIYGLLDFYAIIFDWSSLNDNRGTATVTLKHIATGDEYTVDVINGLNVVQVERDLNPVGIALDAGQYDVSLSWPTDARGYHSKTMILMYDRGIFVLHPEETKQFQVEGFAGNYGLKDCYALFADWSYLGDNFGEVQLSINEYTEPTVETVVLDVKPGSCINPMNVKSKGVLPVAVIGDELFDVKDIDTASIRLEGVAPIRSRIRDISSTPCEERIQDGNKDLVLKFKTQDIVNAIGEVSHREIVPLQITGSLEDGTEFVGEDTVRIIKKGKKKDKKKEPKDK